MNRREFNTSLFAMPIAGSIGVPLLGQELGKPLEKSSEQIVKELDKEIEEDEKNRGELVTKLDNLFTRDYLVPPNLISNPDFYYQEALLIIAASNCSENSKKYMTKMCYAFLYEICPKSYQEELKEQKNEVLN